MANDKKSMGAAGLIGMVIGAAAGAAAVALADKKNRQRVLKAADKLQKEGGRTLEDLKNMAKKFLEETEEEKEKTKKRLPRPAES